VGLAPALLNKPKTEKELKIKTRWTLLITLKTRVSI
jgi:hypothetical protein